MRGISKIYAMADILCDKPRPDNRYHGSDPQPDVAGDKPRKQRIMEYADRIAKGLADKRRAKQVAKEDAAGERQRKWRANLTPEKKEALRERWRTEAAAKREKGKAAA